MSSSTAGDAKRSPYRIAVAITTYLFMSTTMLVVNKLAIRDFPFPNVVLLLQILTSCGFVVLVHAFQFISLNIGQEAIVPFASYSAAFVVGLYANLKVLEHESASLLIAGRSTFPIIVCVVDWAFLGRELPNRRTTFSLLGIAGSIALYMVAERRTSLRRMTDMIWFALWIAACVFQASFGKFLTSHLPFSHWERVFMTNSMAAPYLVVFIISTSKDDLIEMSIREFRLHWVMFSCVCGVGISFASWILRDAVSATTNSLINVIANIGQLAAINIVFGDTSTMGNAALILCVVSGIFYQEAPLRGVRDTSPHHSVLVATSAGLNRTEAGAVPEEKGACSLLAQ